MTVCPSCLTLTDGSGVIVDVDTSRCPVHGGAWPGSSFLAGTIRPPWLACAPTAANVLEAIARAVSRLLPHQSHAVAGEMGLVGDLRVHVLDDVESHLLDRVRDEVQRDLPLSMRLHVTSWTQHPPERRVRALAYCREVRERHAPVYEVATACGHCGMREVRARRCGFCGGRS